MKIIFFAHPLFLGSHSMSRFAGMLADGMGKRGHHVEIWRPDALFSRLPVTRIKKWLGYIDQYLIFPLLVKAKMLSKDNNVLYVLSDHALGPYMGLIHRKRHIIHCHDFLAQKSALGQLAENPTSSTGKIYQAYIRRGYQKGKHFISVSKQTKADLEKFLPVPPIISEMIYNGLSSSFQPSIDQHALQLLSAKLNLPLNGGFIMHVGGNQWYKNRSGIILIYNQWRAEYKHYLPLVLIGEEPSPVLKELRKQSDFRDDIHFITGLSNAEIRVAYTAATLFIFPSLAEGFGWPIAEAMASGIPVITTDEAPMTEVAGAAAFLLKRKPLSFPEENEWAINSAAILNQVVSLSPSAREIVINQGIQNCKRFDMEEALDHIERVYLRLYND